MGVINVTCNSCGSNYDGSFNAPFSVSINGTDCKDCGKRTLSRNFAGAMQIYEDRIKQPLRRVEIVFDSPEMPL